MYMHVHVYTHKHKHTGAPCVQMNQVVCQTSCVFPAEKSQQAQNSLLGITGLSNPTKSLFSCTCTIIHVCTCTVYEAVFLYFNFSKPYITVIHVFSHKGLENTCVIYGCSQPRELWFIDFNHVHKVKVNHNACGSCTCSRW